MAITDLAWDPGLRRRIGAAARARVEERYSVKANRPAYLKIFDEVYRGAKPA